MRNLSTAILFAFAMLISPAYRKPNACPNILRIASEGDIPLLGAYRHA